MIVKLQNTGNRDRRLAFTLIEILVVVAIILMLATVGVVSVMNFLDGARRDTARVRAKALETAVEAFKIKNGYYPATLQDLTVQQPDGGPPVLTQEGMLDPWKQPYQYNPGNVGPTGTPYIISNGPPGGTTGPIANQPLN